MFKWTIIYCKRYDGFMPHLNAIKLSNPEHELFVIDTSNDYPKKMAWMECDLILRPNIKKILPYISNNNIALVEWDTLILDKLPNIQINNLYADTIYYNGGAWIPGAKKHFSNTEYEPHIVCAARFCFYFMPKKALEIWTDTKNDYWFTKRMSCEVRLPTLLSYNNIKPKKFLKPYLIKEKQDQFKIIEKNIYHPVLSEISIKKLNHYFTDDVFHNVFLNET